ncbi:Hypothetical predicted protein [Paramuricea clavata]|uniref:Uncharacterized protein n=1 Tax=Paramuricea clavata TaxID=317549 RepID=A0A6S7G6Z2_PARCT|nr:Hypothetical predicted protein [Paramuricea clavata]
MAEVSEKKFWVEMDDKLMRTSIEVFALEEVKNFKLEKPEHWKGTAEQQQHLFEHIVARYLWKHVYEGLPTDHSGAPSGEVLKLWCDNFTNDIATGWGSMVKTFLKCISVFGVIQPEGIFCQKTIPELLKMKYYFHNMSAGSKRRIMDRRYKQVYELVDLVYFKSIENIF